MAGRCCVEDDVVVGGNQGRIGQQGSKFVEGSNLRRAGSGKLLLNAPHHGIRKLSAYRPNDALPILLCGQLRIDFQGREPDDVGNLGDAVADGLTEYLANIRRRIGTDQENLPALSSQINCGGTRERCFPHATLAGKKQEGGDMV